MIIAVATEAAGGHEWTPLVVRVGWPAIVHPTLRIGVHGGSAVNERRGRGNAGSQE
jgi:hypothetical protein